MQYGRSEIRGISGICSYLSKSYIKNGFAVGKRR
jgi:hypothetical protein